MPIKDMPSGPKPLATSPHLSLSILLPLSRSISSLPLFLLSCNTTYVGQTLVGKKFKKRSYAGKTPIGIRRNPMLVKPQQAQRKKSYARKTPIGIRNKSYVGKTPIGTRKKSYIGKAPIGITKIICWTDSNRQKLKRKIKNQRKFSLQQYYAGTLAKLMLTAVCILNTQVILKILYVILQI